MRIRSWICLAICLICAVAHAEQVTRQMSLVLNGAIKAEPKARTNTKNWPVHLDFVVQGEQLTQVYGWSGWRPGVMPKAKIVQQQPTAAGWQVICELTYPDELPTVMGGVIQIHLDLQRAGDVITGDYKASITPTDVNTLKSQLMKSGLKNFLQIRRKLIAAKTESITKIAKRLPGGITRADPITMTGELKDVDPLLLIKEVPAIQVGQAPQIDQALLKIAQSQEPRAIADVRLAYREAHRQYEQGMDRDAFIASCLLTDRWLMHAVGESGALSRQQGVQAVLDLLVFQMRARHVKQLLSGQVWARWEAIEKWRIAKDAIRMDRQLGRVVLRSNDENNLVTMYDLARGDKGAAHLRGQMTLDGFGRSWLRYDPPTRPAGYTSYESVNAMRLIEASKTAEKAAFPYWGGRVHRMRVFDKGMSVAMKAGGYYEKEKSGEKQVDGAYSWRTLGVDMSGKSGAPYVAVIVEGVQQPGKRQPLWQLNVGKLEAEEVEAKYRHFAVKPKGAKAWLKGTIVYPETARVRYDAETGMLVAKIKGEQTSTQQLLEDRINKLMGEAAGEEMTLPIALEEEEELNIGADHWAMFNKLLKHTSSNKMGGGDRAPRAFNSVVVVLTLQETGKAAPKLEVQKELDAFLKLGSQQIKYTEFLVEFE